MLLAVLGVGPAAAQEAPAPMPQVGDTRTFEDGLLTVDCDRWTVEETDADGYVVSACGEYRLYQAIDADYNTVKILDGGGREVVSFEPFFPGLSFPLYEDKVWTGHYKGYTAHNGARWKGELTCEVERYERTEPPAFRIACEDRWRALLGLVRGVTRSTQWYAPAVGAVVEVISPDDPRWNLRMLGWR